MKFNLGILRSYDIRGEYEKDFDDEFACRLGGAVVEYIGAKTLIVARDMRPSALGITSAVIKGITEAGCNVIDVDTASTPFFYYSVIFGEADAGIMVTASHMGEAFNGFKICKKDAMVIGKDTGLQDLAKIIQGTQDKSNKIGSVKKGDYIKKHADFIVSHSQLKRGEVDLRVAIDSAPMIRKEIAEIFEILEIQLVNKDFDIKFEFDPDGDRVLVYNSKNKSIRADMYQGVLASDLANNKKHFLLHLGGGPKIVSDLRASRGVTDYLKEQGIALIPSKIGHTNIKKVMKDNNIDFAGESSGHVMFKEMKYAESTQLAVLKLLKILSVEKKSIDELIAPMNTWSYSGEINMHIEGWPESVSPIIKKAKEKYSDGEINELDGLRVDYSDWWFLIRASGTEPVMRLIVEARTKEMMDEKIKELQDFIQVPSSV